MNKTHLLLLTLLLAFFLRLVPLAQSLWLDEAINVINARDRALSDLVTNYSLADFHPPLYHPVLHYWIRIFGDSEVSVRFPSVLFGLITVYALYRISRIIFPQKKLKIGRWKVEIALLPTLFLAVSGLHIYYSGEARMYSLAAMWVTLAVYFALKLDPRLGSSVTSAASARDQMKAQLSSPYFAPFVLSLIGILYTDYVAWLILPLFFFFYPFATSLAAGAVLPWVPFLARQLNLGLAQAADFPAWNQVVGGFSLKNLILIPVKFTLGRISLDNNLLYGLVLVPILLLILVLLLKFSLAWQKSSRPWQLVGLWFLLPLVLGLILSTRISILSYFRFLFLLPAFYLILVKAALSFRGRLSTALLAYLLFLTASSSAIYLVTPRFHREDWRSLVAWVEDTRSLHAAVIFPSLAQSAPFDYYHPSLIPYESVRDVPYYPDQIYLLRYVQDLFDPQDLKRQEIEALGFQLVAQRSFNGVDIWVFLPRNQLLARK